ncbi:MAG TPA: hypothetical protein VFD44_05835, partial [Hanamia sp.]|nr:hypothetical protein [Hanamia sp.]
EVVRAWQGHQQEEKWFYVVEGSFKIAVVKPDNWQHPSLNLPVEEYKLSADKYKFCIFPAVMPMDSKRSNPNQKSWFFLRLLWKSQ